MKKQVDVAVTALLAIAATGLSAAFVYRTFYGTSTATSSSWTQVRQWPEVLAGGLLLSGSERSQFSIAVLSDLQCPACAGYHTRVLNKAVEKYGENLRVVFLHFPLDYHDLAVPAARATECLAKEENPRAWLDFVFSKQDSLPIFGIDGMLDRYKQGTTSRLRPCYLSEESAAAVSTAVALGKQVGVSGTPTVVVEGFKAATPPSLSVIDSVLASRTGK